MGVRRVQQTIFPKVVESSQREACSGGAIRRLLQCFLIPFLTNLFYPSTTISNLEDGLVAKAAIQTYRDHTIATLSSRNGSAKCNMNTVSVRRAWDDLKVSERMEYIDAVKCVMAMPAVTDPMIAPGARTHWDDFVYTHITQTNFVHLCALFLPWHRQFMQTFENTLRDSCGYTGYLPYWAWERHSENQSKTPVFQDEPWSFGAEGFNATGGKGCLTGGAFASHVANIGPVDAFLGAESLVYNPHCLVHDFDQSESTYALSNSLLDRLYRTRDINEFQPLFQHSMHRQAHLYIGGEAEMGGSAPNEPAFYLLHSSIDRVWSIWQSLDWDTRKDAVWGTETFLNVPPSPVGTMNSTMRFGSVGHDMKIGEAMDPLDEKYCYMYE